MNGRSGEAAPQRSATRRRSGLGRPLLEGAASNDQDAATDLMAAMSPTGELDSSRCLRSLREESGVSINSDAAAQRDNRFSVCVSVKCGFLGHSGIWFSTKSAVPLRDGVRELIGQNVIRGVSFGFSCRFRLA